MGQAKRNRDLGVTNKSNHYDPHRPRKVAFVDNSKAASFAEMILGLDKSVDVQFGFPTNSEGVTSAWLFRGKSAGAYAFEIPTFALDTDLGCAYYLGKNTKSQQMDEWAIYVDGPDGTALDIYFIGRSPTPDIVQAAVRSVMDAFAADPVASSWIDTLIWARSGHGAIQFKCKLSKPGRSLGFSPNIANGFTVCEEVEF
ncbi:MAG: hypothetical protein Q7R40_19205 [Phaeospirillum sp.]|nr:hypothetical protein [Phaeospirillum sp.]